jgi:hypothetical protein
MEKKFKMTIRELLTSSKDYSNYSKEDLIMQYNIIMNQYEDFKNHLNINNISQNTKHERFNTLIIQEIDNHLNIIKVLMNNY